MTLKKISRSYRTIFENVNNCVYRAGFATIQEVYEEECQRVYAALVFASIHRATTESRSSGSVATCRQTAAWLTPTARVTSTTVALAGKSSHHVFSGRQDAIARE
jgi:hypothetical protein